MKRKTIIIAAAVAAACALVLICALVSKKGQEEPEVPTTSLKSEDGQAELIIPDGALPEGTALADISIERASNEEFFGDAEATGIAYSLLPDGLELNRPVTVSLTAETPEGDSGSIPPVLHVAGEDVEWLSPSKVVIDQTAGTITVSAEIGHFSKVGTDAERAVFDYTLDAGGTARVGETLPFRVTIKPNDYNHWYDHGYGYEPYSDMQKYTARGHYYRYNPGSRYTVHAFTMQNSDILSPMKVTSPKQTLGHKETFSFSQDFTCEKVGTVSAFAFSESAKISYESRVTGQDRWGKNYDRPRGDSTYVILFGNDFVCEEALPPMEFVGPPYLVDCGGGVVISGTYKVNPATGEILTDANGNELDRETGQPITCP